MNTKLLLPFFPQEKPVGLDFITPFLLFIYVKEQLGHASIRIDCGTPAATWCQVTIGRRWTSSTILPTKRSPGDLRTATVRKLSATRLKNRRNKKEV